MVIYGTRPEAIKMAPLVKALDADPDLTPIVAVTGQHRHMLDQVNELFGIKPAHDLNIITPRQTLAGITERALNGLSELIEAEEPDMIAVQGDTTTSFVAALAAFYAQVPVVHLEAGLRTANAYNPFPEEINRRLTSQIATLHLAPTSTSRANLLHDGIAADRIVVTGNTVIDALLDVVGMDIQYSDSRLAQVKERRTILITSHRRESWGEPMKRVAASIRELALKFSDDLFVLPAHLNPVVREVLLPPLADLQNVLITEPLPYGEFSQLMNDSHVILTDSGGVQEEGPSLGKPVLVMRETTERPEAVTEGTVKLVGTDPDLIVSEVSSLLLDDDRYREMANAVNPYGDGKAAARSIHAIRNWFNLEPDMPADFEPGSARG
jgi:UDP-N-acetylglucosamine 2-epimerase (non-hydrolysing)